MATQAAESPGTPPRIYYYYSSHDDQHNRKTFAGMVEDGVLKIAYAGVFHGVKPFPIDVALKNGQVIQIMDPGIPADHFVKAYGRKEATEKLTGIVTLNTGKVIRKKPNLFFSEVVPINDPNFNPGKRFVSIVEAHLRKLGYPPKPVKTKKKKATGL